MKILPIFACITFLLSSCAAQNYHYQSYQNPQKWEGQNISAVQHLWGSADQTLHTRNGTSYYLYNTNAGRNFFDATSTNFALASTGNFQINNQTGLQCSAIFTTNKDGTIIGTSHAGNNCGGQWAPNN